VLGVRAEQTQLEEIAKPLTAEEAEAGRLPGDEGAAEQPLAAGRRRHRLGPGRGWAYYSPGMVGTALRSREAAPSLLDREVDRIVGELERGGPLRREELAVRVGARRWGPGRFGAALAEAAAAGRVRRVSRSTFDVPREP
jgi:hypothetical protein